MANLCKTTYACIGEASELQSLENVLKQLEKGKDLSLDNLVKKLGGNPHLLKCAGCITCFSLRDDTLYIEQDTAWCEQSDVRYLIQQKYPSLEVYFLDEEPGCEHFCTNDSSGICFPMRYRVENYNDTEDFNNLEEVAEYFSELTEQPVAADLDIIQTCIKDYVTKMQQEEDEDYQCLLYEYRLVEC